MGREKGAETEISTTGWRFNTYACWVKPQHKSINIASESLWRGNKWCWGEGALLRRAWTLRLLYFSLALKLLSISLFLSFLLDINLKTVIESFPEFGHLFHWVFEHGGGVMEFLSFSHLVRSMTTWEHMAGIWSQGILDTSTLALAQTPQIWYQKSVDSGRPAGCWELDGWCKNHVFSARKKPRLTLSYDVRAQVRLGERWVVKVRPRTWKLCRVLCIVEFLANQ